jgi:acetyl esterase/lipase
MYVSAQYATSQLTIVSDLVFSRRPNEGSQFTSEVTRVAEQGSATLSLKLDLAIPPNATAARRQPLVIWFHGGGFVSGGKGEFTPHMLSYAQAGYVAASVNFRLTPGIETNPAARVRALQQGMEDAMNAIRYLKVNAGSYGIDPTRVATFGNSAGGAISLVNAVEFDTLVNTVSDYPGVSSKVQAAVSTGATLVEAGANADSFVTYNATDTPVLLFHANPIDGVSGATWAGNVLPTQARINNSGNSCIVVAQPSGGHTVDLSLGGSYWMPTKAFLWSQLHLYELR